MKTSLGITKIIFATRIAQNSITIPDLSIVIDCEKIGIRNSTNKIIYLLLSWIGFLKM